MIFQLLFLTAVSTSTWVPFKITILQGVYKVLKVLKCAKMVKVLKKVLKSAKINQKVLKNYSTKHKAI